MLYLGTTRFNNKTYSENQKYCKENNIEGCIYGLPVRIAQKIKRGALVIVIDMNIETKKIIGIGRIVNFVHRDKKYRIYTEWGYNRYIYKGRQYYKIENIKDKESIEILENKLFKGKGHMCRGQGITCLNPEKLDKNKKKVITFIKDLFG